jgi:hypothetical protein
MRGEVCHSAMFQLQMNSAVHNEQQQEAARPRARLTKRNAVTAVPIALVCRPVGESEPEEGTAETGETRFRSRDTELRNTQMW